MSSLAQCFVENSDNGITNYTLPKKHVSPITRHSKKGLTIPRRSWITQRLLQIIHNLSIDAQRWVEQVGHA